MASSFHVFAPAKVNLFLHVTGKRADGYHTLQSLVAFADVGDELSFSPHDGFIFETAGVFAGLLPETADNLVARAARELAAEHNVPCHAAITLTKNLPVAAGLGGGSADAAAALRGLARLWTLPEDPSRLRALALRLGADIPVCLEGRAAYVSGIGETLDLIKDMPPFFLVLVNPLIPVPTAEVFKNFHETFSATAALPAVPSGDFLASCRNDLVSAAVSVAPEITGVLKAIDETGAFLARLSGSGATCFGLYADAAGAKEAAKKLVAAHPGWWVKASTV